MILSNRIVVRTILGGILLMMLLFLRALLKCLVEKL